MSHITIRQIRRAVVPTLILFLTFFKYLPIPLPSGIPPPIVPLTGLNLAYGIVGILVMGGLLLLVTYLVSLLGLRGQRRYPAIYVAGLLLATLIFGSLQWDTGRWVDWLFTGVGLFLTVTSWRAGGRSFQTGV